MNIETKSRQTDNQFLARFLVTSGVVGRKVIGEQKLLSVPTEQEGVNFPKGFDPIREVKFIGQITDVGFRDKMLVREVSTQLAEDFGLVKHDSVYDWQEGEIVIPKLGRLSGVTKRGGLESEVIAVKRIEEKLREDPERTVVHFSPKDESVGYGFECVDFWRVNEGRVTSVRIMIENDEEGMRKVWKMLSGDAWLSETENLRANPVATNLMIGEMLPLFEISKAKNGIKYENIENVVEAMLFKLKKKYGNEVYWDAELIARLYSAVYMILDKKDDRGRISVNSQRKLDFYVSAKMTETRVRPSSGCSSSTNVNGFTGEGMIIIVTADGISFRKGSTEGLNYCSRCGCWYSGEKCPICK